MARSTTYKQATALVICTRMASGEPLTKICKDKALPCAATVYKWLREQSEFREMYATAKEDMAHSLAAEILEIADDAPLIVDIDGQQVTVKLDMAAVQRNRLRVDTRKWAASRLLPRVYAEQIGVGAAADLPPIADIDLIEAGRRIAFVLARADNALHQQQLHGQAPPLKLAVSRST